MARSGAQLSETAAALAPLAERTREGDTGAFRELVAATHERLYRLAVHLMRDRDEAEDVVQETFIRAWQRRSDLRDPAAVVPWLSRIARNAARDRLRWWRRRPEKDRAEVVDAPDAHTLADERLVSQERAAEVRRALDVLSEKHRVILLLREVEDMSYEQIAELLGLPIGTVESRLHRARAALAGKLARLEKRS